jgi:Uma2 family endonuclease
MDGRPRNDKKPSGAPPITSPRRALLRYAERMTSVETLLTADQFALLPEPAEGGKMELVEGKVVCMTPVGQQHGRRASRLIALLLSFVDEHELGYVGTEIGFRLAGDPDTLLAPDVVFVAEDPSSPEQVTYVNGPPTLAVEIMSPNDLEQDVSQKVDRYLAAGTLRVWVVRPAVQSVTVHRPGGDSHTYSVGDTLGSDDAAFPAEGFELPLADIFA